MNLNKKTSSRNSSIELLRIVLMCGVITLHYVSDNGQLLANTNGETFNFLIIIIMNSLFVCAVDAFIFITGYYSCLSYKLSTRKIIQLFLEVIIFQILLYLTSICFSKSSFNLGDFFFNLIPRNYYVMLYSTLLLISPFINKMLNTLERNKFKLLVVLIIILFLIEPTLSVIIEGLFGETIYGISTIGVLGPQWGYTIVTFVSIYIIAAYIRKNGSFWNEKYNGVVWFFSLAILVVWKYIEVMIGVCISAEHYMNPVVVINAISVFLIFKNMSFKNSLINIIAKGCFTVFITHALFVSRLSLLNFVNSNPFIFFTRWLVYILAIFVITDIIGLIYAYFETNFFDFISNLIGFYIVDLNETKKEY